MDAQPVLIVAETVFDEDDGGRITVTRFDSDVARSRAAAEYALTNAARRSAAMLPRQADRPPPAAPLERAVVDSLIESLAASRHGGSARPQRLAVLDWMPAPRDVDLVCDIPDAFRLLAEVKIWNVSETLWDALKLLSVEPDDDAVTRALIVVARAADWEPTNPCVPLFEEGREWDTREVLTNTWRRAWEYLIGPRGGPARPTSLPGRFASRPILSERLAQWEDNEMRVAVIRRVGNTRIELQDGWPVPHAP
jgi:hypothetical protein